MQFQNFILKFSILALWILSTLSTLHHIMFMFIYISIVCILKVFVIFFVYEKNRSVKSCTKPFVHYNITDYMT